MVATGSSDVSSQLSPAHLALLLAALALANKLPRLEQRGVTLQAAHDAGYAGTQVGEDDDAARGHLASVCCCGSSV